MLLRFLSRESTVAMALAGLVLWAPLPAASATPAAQLFFRLAALAILVMALAARPRGWPRREVVAVAALAAVGLLGLAQSLPWPVGVAALLSPEHADLYREAAALAGAETPRPFLPLSLDAAVTRSSAVSWLVGAALLAGALTAGRRRRHRRWLLWALSGTASVQLAIGLARLERQAPEGLGEVVLRPVGRLAGTYANPNSVSFLFEVALVAVAAWCWWAWRRAATPRRWLTVGAPLGLWLALLAGVVLTGSRAGLVAALLATAVQAALLPLTDRRRRTVVLSAVVILGLGLGALAMVGSRVEISRYQTVSLFEDNLRSRLLLVEPALELWRRFPLTGTGLGTFEDGFPLVAPPELSSIHWNRAHNDPLELLVTGGVVGLGLAGLGALALLGPIWRSTRHGRRLEDRAAGLAAMGAFAAAGFHELLDFGLVMPANSLALVAVLGSAAAAGLSPESGSPG